MKKIALFIDVATSCAGVMAQFAAVEGAYKSPKTSLQVILLDDENGVVAAAITVVQSPCSGSVAGIGKIKLRGLSFQPYAKVAGGESCIVSVEWDAQWRNAKVTDNGACSVYHGSSCTWSEARLVKRETK